MAIDINSTELIEKTAAYMRNASLGESSGHDWWHTWRVWQYARNMGIVEESNLLITELGALLHDIHDWKFAEGSTEVGALEARAWLLQCNAPESVIVPVTHIVKEVSFKGAGVPDVSLSLEGAIVRDADRLDAMGALGIARAFAYGGSEHRPLHNPLQPPQHHTHFLQYQSAQGGTRNHFDEKLLLLKDRMCTVTGKALAQKKHAFMVQFLTHFDAEWQGEDV